ncbi:hypothetical protein B0I08_102303 [Glaciihabitans tibetensis]|uniref:Uncharacterized protein n=1 Tax=Glaciihabitans tibetensis TaxID=1266600 RepID=A0A2T0VHD0_9MICO|nr:hypothetical protein [Glaciihabitans tibetensis]PRY69626.1 hypothetical protein B0I08_102303 [Glaciihabitans tibetensis]
MSQPDPNGARLTAVPRVVVPDRTYWGLRSPDTTMELRQRARHFSIMLPRQSFYTHTTAARLHGIPVPARVDGAIRYHVTRAAPDRVASSLGVCGHGLKMGADDVVEHDRVRLTSVERTWCDLGGLLALPDLVAAGDYLIHWQDPLTSQRRLAQAVEQLPNRRNVRILRAAVASLSDRSDSPPESMLRVILAAGRFPPAVVTRVVSDGYGEYIAHTDFLIEELGVLLHYRSADVRGTIDDPWGWSSRDDNPTDGNPLVIELDSDDLRDPAGLIDRIWTCLRTQGTPRY